MSEAKNFLDNLKNLRLVMSVALEYVQTNRKHFIDDATTTQLGQLDRYISQIRTHAEQLEKEFDTLEYLVSKRHPKSTPLEN